MPNLCFPATSLIAAATVKEVSTGVEFPAIIRESRKLLGVGVRRNCMLGLEHIDIYVKSLHTCIAEGIYEKLLMEKYGESPVPEDKVLAEDIMENDVCMTIRLLVVFGN
ncbi:hypothetical protein MLD38_012311 [Melastoma candidum]|uniref:Uncharacterized protein n=1 Tax=Melastoma candidum TaxID=119954 RepID=A0ACB9R8Y0_9MYRT|nr:hypothetical protein MLD38_012311 [Melastoma candidum]